jgi:hypothetical protein
MSNADAKAMVEAVFAHVQACYDAEQQHQDALAAETTWAGVRDYDMSAGWPN